VFALNVTGGFLFLLRATVVTILMPLVAALIVRAVERLAQSGFAVSPDLKVRYPTLEARANRYLPVLQLITAVIVYAFAALVLLETWGLNAFAWLDTDPGRRLTGSFVTIAAVVIGALIVWELLGSAIERYLHATDGTGTRLARSARARTLLPLLRTTVLVTLVVLAGLTVMAAVGVDIAPLLAGAGVVGLAVGFGSQALVKDVITGLFILIEDTMAVGDVVDVGKGSGVVEALTIRTIKLRDQSGTLQTIPFSEVSTIKNMARDYAYAVLDVGVLYREDPERVIATLRAIAAEMAEDGDWRWRMLAPLEVIGLDRFTDSAQVIRVRLKTAPLAQWPVQREFNLRMKKAFDDAGIEMPSTNQTRYLEPPPAA
jgi:small conductance mechanosensitive channel